MPKMLFRDSNIRSPTAVPSKSEMCSFVKTLRIDDIWEPRKDAAIQRIFIWPDGEFSQDLFHDRGVIRACTSTIIPVHEGRHGPWKDGEDLDVLALMRASKDVSLMQAENGDQKADLATKLMGMLTPMQTWSGEIMGPGKGPNKPLTINPPSPLHASELVVTLIDFINNTEQMVARRSPGFVLNPAIMLSRNEALKFTAAGTASVYRDVFREGHHKNLIIEIRGMTSTQVT